MMTKPLWFWPALLVFAVSVLWLVIGEMILYVTLRRHGLPVKRVLRGVPLYAVWMYFRWGRQQEMQTPRLTLFAGSILVMTILAVASIMALMPWL